MLDDHNPDERAHGIAAGQAWAKWADLTAVYTDHGITTGMQQGIDFAHSEGITVELRTLHTTSLDTARNEPVAMNA